MGKKDKKHKGTKRGRGGRSLSKKADKYDLYQRAVNSPEADIWLIKRVFRNHYGRRPHLLREDFCGTALLACDWAKDHEDNRAFGIDLDPEPLEWGRRHNMASLTPEQAARVKLIEGNVMDIGHEEVDATVAFNFSYFLFETRPELRSYFERARASLRSEGLLYLDMYGGADAQRTSEEVREIDDDFDYVWDQHSFDPIHQRCMNYIHFDFPDGSRMRRAFSYGWRLWSIPEIRELLIEAGFSDTEIYWEGTDKKTGEGNDVYTKREKADDDPAWVAYVVGVK